METIPEMLFLCPFPTTSRSEGSLQRAIPILQATGRYHFTSYKYLMVIYRELPNKGRLAKSEFTNKKCPIYAKVESLQHILC